MAETKQMPKTTTKPKKEAKASKSEVKVEVSTKVETAEPETKTIRAAKVRSNKYKKAKANIDRAKLYTIKQAVELVQANSLSKFDGNIDAHLVLNTEPGTVAEITFPHLKTGTKKIVIADESIVKKIEKGTIDFDVLVSTPSFMPKLLPLAKVLGPKGLMPNPKTGTLADNPQDAVKKLQAAKMSVKTEKKAPLVHIKVGKISQKADQVVANIEKLIKVVNPLKIKKLYITPTMGPSVKVKIDK